MTRVSQTITGARRELGAQLAQLRTVAGYTQDRLGRETGYSRSTVANVEAGTQPGTRAFWERCDQLYCGGDGSLTSRFDEIAVALRALRQSQSAVEDEARAARAADSCGVELAKSRLARARTGRATIAAVQRAFAGVSFVNDEDTTPFSTLESRVLDACRFTEQRLIGKPVLTLVGGYAGSGKTEFARFLSSVAGWAFLDKDTLTRPLVESFLTAMGQDPDGRDESGFYQAQIRNLEYRCLVNAALENLGSNLSTVAAAPFIRELTDRSWLARIRNGCACRGADLVVVWVRCDEESMYDYLSYRGAARDHYKLRNWGQWYSTVDPYLRPVGDHYVVDNNLQASVSIADQARELVTQMRRQYA